MKEVIVKILLIALALACLSVVAFPTIWQDGKDTKERAKAHYQNMFQ
ncbi:hypothetical protein [Paenibacillus abyssi]|uniref:Uncharacterized protein n=1 Tax=Paenibacillus abyssi TaxID=1340531 RepID=A0A917LFI9_9BACL|nr:hypothetical protein [Paenibacillus abyssi]GGG18828.1 hypothetical protein GCM10010916_39550 [Paenibacillus abyssi]